MTVDRESDGVQVPQQERARVTRENIIVGAATVIHRAGVVEASLSEIATEAGVTKGALYFHFASKEALVEAVITEEHRIARDSALAILAVPAGPIERMLRLSHDLAELLLRDVVVRAGLRLAAESSPFSPTVRRPYDDWFDTYEHLATRAEAAGETNGLIPPAVLARQVVSGFVGAQLISNIRTQHDDLHARLLEMWQLILTAILPEETRSAALARAAELFGGSATEARG